jgi:hypothetical protein
VLVQQIGERGVGVDGLPRARFPVFIGWPIVGWLTEKDMI